MENPSITFSCPACGIKLTVPVELGGVIGPCPSCRTQIQAPYPAPQPLLDNPPAPVLSQLPVPASAPEIPAPPAESKPAPSPIPAALRREPRQLPSRANPLEAVAKEIPTRNLDKHPLPAVLPPPQYEAPHSRNFLRILLPVLFLIATIAIVFGLMSLFKSAKSPFPARPDSSQLPQPSPEASSSPAVPSSEAAQPALAEPQVPAPPDPEQATPAMRATETLEKFLAAKSLGERMSLIETQTPEAELADSIIARSLPEARSILIDLHETHATEQILDIYFNVDLADGDKQVSPQTLLVRTRGTGSPKVVVDPFLDAFGGRLAAYAAAPSDHQGVFQVIVSALASCNEKQVPNRERKLTLKLLSRDNTKEIARAYFGKRSKIGLMLEDGTSSLNYGKAQACTVLLQWNTEENPEMPFLEVIGLKSLNWNP